ncbi:DUF1659 domain-containing protein [Clostridium botulinum]|uniref:DUF1659 domain-containing protein n=1 Tax=unclassified Clostridium TaxID=2614128 RepID=UPI000503CF4E|nr:MULTISPECIES: DUF1659 domain-containing protein [unclassified Clostridium]AIY79583.1 hypothetical protein U728_1530 [Clostridium botulinum 202F]KAI3346712.1 DUF1659 domain-containing protein [Clostridium botulinum]KFX53768.1 hypothetical protein KU40_17520 [Clostridium botulinum]KON13934.1 hypothetical protein ACP50_07695 [Clostridium botulinum]MBY6780053.1 DUF1659 domain-containing protein [Clostridium botulinum]
MAVTKLQIGCTLGIKVHGDSIYSKKSFSNVNPKKTPDEVFEVASKIEEVIEANCGNYFITDTSKLMSE